MGQFRTGKDLATVVVKELGGGSSVGFEGEVVIIERSSHVVLGLIIPNSFAGLQKLEELNVSSNPLKSLPDSIGLVTKLKILNALENKLNALRESIALCRYLDAHFNKLSALPLAIGRLENLESFWQQLAICPTLGELNISNNKIRGLPDTFGWLENLRKLNLDQNPLVIPPKEIVRAEEERSMIELKGTKKLRVAGWLWAAVLNYFASRTG
ncbi:hypothetical protein U1Q18_029117 [Sarracenia purpurea var. burkii]